MEIHAHEPAIQWRHKDEWKHSDKTFCVVVSRHTEGGDDPNRWCVYLHIWNNHKSFENFNPDGNMWDQPNFECHSYVSYFKVNRDQAGKIVSYTLGWDYAHDGDFFGGYSTKDEAWEVFMDAKKLVHEAKERAQ